MSNKLKHSRHRLHTTTQNCSHLFLYKPAQSAYVTQVH